MSTWLAAAAITIIAAVAGRWLYERLFGPRPKLKIELRSGSAGTGRIFFIVGIVNTGDRDAVDCDLAVDISGLGPVTPKFVRPRPPFDVERRATVEFSIERPTYGDLVPAFDKEMTLYGRTLTVRVQCGRRTWSGTWREIEYDAATNRARYDIQQEIWRTRTVPEND